MAQTSKIEWTDVTWNPVAGCTIASAGCSNCYAMRMAARLAAMGSEKYAGLTRKSGGRAVWTGKVARDVKSLSAPHKWRKPRKVFVNSMSDLFHPNVPDELRAISGFIRFISFEPLIGPVGAVDLTDIDWAIVGGESGPRSRPMRREWVDQIEN